jgi:hypothetical protein
LAKKLDDPKLSPKKLKDVREGLEELGIDWQKISATRGKDDLGKLDLEQAGLRFSNRVNFTTATHEMPLGWQQSGIVELARQFKSFTYNHTEFIMTEVIKPAKKGLPLLNKGWDIGDIKEFAPLVNYFAVVGPIIGGAAMTTKELAYMALGDDRELNGIQNMLLGFTFVGGLGLWTDMINLYEHNQHAPLSAGMQWAAGPGVETLMDLGNKGLAGDFAGMGKEFIRGTNTPARILYDNFTE